MLRRFTGMKITAPISSPAEIEPLALHGADELYCGIVPQEWITGYGPAVWISRRAGEKANLSGFAALQVLIDAAHGRGIPVFVTLNAPYYTARQLPYVLGLADRLRGMGVDGVIVTDVGLIAAIREEALGMRILLSSVAAVRNAESARFYRDLGVDRIILPRHLTVDEIEHILHEVPEPEYEVFILNDGCVFEEGLCATTHGAGAFCLEDWSYEFSRTDESGIAAGEKAALLENLTDYRRWIWFTANCGRSCSPTGYPNGPCGLCAIHDFGRIGVHALKVVGREGVTDRKVRSVQLVRSVLDRVEQGWPKERVETAAVALRGERQLCGSGYMCYFRDARAAPGEGRA